MPIEWQEQLQPGLALRGIVQEATASLIAMDAVRLEELARCCADLNRGLYECDGIPADVQNEAAVDLRLLRRVLYETRANLSVLLQLREIRLRTGEESFRNKGIEAWARGGEPASVLPQAGQDESYGDN